MLTEQTHSQRRFLFLLALEREGDIKITVICVVMPCSLIIGFSEMLASIYKFTRNHIQEDLKGKM
jgi:hypothetical protein